MSTAEKLGADEDAPELELMPPEELEPPEAAEPLEDDWPLVLPLPDMVLEGELDCEEVEPLLLEGVCAEVEPLLLDLSPAANDAPDSARSAAAVALTRTFIFICVLLLRKGWFAD